MIEPDEEISRVVFPTSELDKLHGSVACYDNESEKQSLHTGQTNRSDKFFDRSYRPK